MTQMQIATIFNVGRPAVTKHINNIYSCGELDINSTCSILEHMGNDGAQCYNVKYFNLDVILSVGYRVNSKNAIAFRRWASCILKDYLLRGYSINSRISQIEDKFDRRIREQDKRIEEHERKIDFFVRTSLPPVEGIFFEGQVFDAYSFVASLIRKARQRIVLIDNYIDDTVLTLLHKRGNGVNATIHTYQISKQLELDIAEITPDATFESQGIDSLDVVEMIMDLESELGIELEMEDQKIATFQDLADFVESKLN